MPVAIFDDDMTLVMTREVVEAVRTGEVAFKICSNLFFGERLRFFCLYARLAAATRLPLAAKVMIDNMLVRAFLQLLCSGWSLSQPKGWLVG